MPVVPTPILKQFQQKILLCCRPLSVTFWWVLRSKVQFSLLIHMKRVLPSFPRDHWRNCRLNSSNSIGSECCLEFVIFLQPMVRVTIIHDLVTTFIVVHDRFTTNGYALPVPHVLVHKMDLQWKPQSNLYKKIHTCTTWSSHQNFYSSA